MQIGFLGAGTVAKTIAKHVLAFDHEVLLSNSRGPETLSALTEELGPGASAGTSQEAAAQQLVILATRWSNVQPALSVIPDWSGRVIVDTTNRFASYEPPSIGDVSGRTSSEIVADLAPGAKVVKAFNSVPMSWISDFSPTKPRTALFISGDDPEAKRQVAALIDQIGFGSIDLGSLAIGGRLQQVGGPLGGIKLLLDQRMSL